MTWTRALGIPMLRVIIAWLVFLPLAGAAVSASAGEFRAIELTPDNIALIPDGGPDAIGGIGDWFATNGVLCIVVTGKGRPTYLALTGGVLADVWFCEQANDQWSTAHQQLNMRKEFIPPISEINASTDEESAWIETTANMDGVKISTRYSLNAVNKRQLHIDTTMERVSTGKPLNVYGFTVLHPHGSLTPFTLDTNNRSNSRGFNQPEVNTDSILSILSSLHTADLQILLGSRQFNPSVAYGLRTLSATRSTREGNVQNLSGVMLGGQFFTVYGLFPEKLPWWSPGPGFISLALSQLMDITLGERLTLHQALMVSDHADAASLTDRIYDGRRIVGKLDTADAGITVLDTSDNPITFVRPNADGRFEFTLPGSVRRFGRRDLQKIQLSIVTPWSKFQKSFKISANATDLGEINTGGRGKVVLPSGSPMSLLFSTSTGNIIFNSEFTDAEVAGDRQLTSAESIRLSLAGAKHDISEVELPPGRYSVLASRGPEYSVSHTSLRIEAGKTSILEIEVPSRVVETPGMISADLHVHSAASFDSSLPAQQRVKDFVAQGAEVIVASEHNVTFSLQNAIEDLGLQARVANIPGVEISGMVRTPTAPYTIAHSNIFPVVVQPDAHAGGTRIIESKRLGHVIEEYKTAFPESLMQLNHPRSGVHDSDIAFFNHLTQGESFDPTKALDHGVNASLIETLADSSYRDIDFDAIELLNSDSMHNYEPVRTDWFALLAAGYYKVVTANSDSHASSELVGLPRNYVAVENDNPKELDTNAFISAIKRGHVYGTTGPILSVSFEGLPPGSVYQGARGSLSLMADAADWMELTEYRIWMNGVLQSTLPATKGQTLSLDIEATGDSYLFVELVGEAKAIYNEVAPGLAPFAFANPIFIDPEGDGWKGHSR